MYYHVARSLSNILTLLILSSVSDCLLFCFIYTAIDVDQPAFECVPDDVEFSIFILGLPSDRCVFWHVRCMLVANDSVELVFIPWFDRFMDRYWGISMFIGVIAMTFWVVCEFIDICPPEFIILDHLCLEKSFIICRLVFGYGNFILN